MTHQETTSDQELVTLPALTKPVTQQLKALQSDLARSSIKRGLLNHGVVNVDDALGGEANPLVLRGRLANLVAGTNAGRIELEGLYQRRARWRQWTFAASMATAAAAATLMIVLLLEGLWAGVDNTTSLATSLSLGTVSGAFGWMHRREDRALTELETDLRDLRVLETKIRLAAAIECTETRDELLARLF